MGPGAFERRGALFRLCETIWDIADDSATTTALGLRARGRAVNIKFSETPFRLGVSGGVGVATSTASRSKFLARRSHGYPGFLPILACEAPRLRGRRWIRPDSLFAARDDAGRFRLARRPVKLNFR